MNEVKVIIRAHNDVSRGFESARADVKRWADESSKIYTERMTINLQTMGEKISGATTKAGRKIGQDTGESGGETITQEITHRLDQMATTQQGQLKAAGQKIGDSLGEEVSTRVNTRVTERLRDSGGGRLLGRAGSGGAGGTGGDSSRGRTVRGGDGGKGGDANVDVDKQSIWSRFADWGKGAAESFRDGFSDRVSNIFNGDIFSTLIKGAAIVALGAALAVPLAAAVTSAVGLALGGGVIAAGVVAAFKDPTILAAGKELGANLKKAFASFGEPFRGPVVEVLEKVNHTLLPQIVNLGKQLAPIFAPLTQRLGDGLIGMLQNMLPGIADAMKNLAPVVQVLADRLPDIGKAIGDFFQRIGNQGDDAAVFFNDLITLLDAVLAIVSSVIAGFTSMYANIRAAVKGGIEVLGGLWDALVGGVNLIIDKIRTLNDGWDSVGDTFRSLWNGIKKWLETGQGYFRTFLRFTVGVFEQVLNAASAAMGWIPGLGGKLRAAQTMFNIFKNNINATLNGIHDKVVSVSIEYSYRTFGKPMSQIDPYGYHGLATGGIKGAASGMMTSGLTWVGERGPELVGLPAGSTVHSSGDSMRMMRQGMAGAGMGGVLQVSVDPGAENTLIGVLVRALRMEIGDKGGSVQDVLGRRI